jgi:hypothetical protein
VLVGVAAASESLLYIAERTRVRTLSLPTRTVGTLAGGTSAGVIDGIGTGARFNALQGITRSPASGMLYVSQSWDQSVRTIDPVSRAVRILVGGARGLRTARARAPFSRRTRAFSMTMLTRASF